MMRPSLRKTLVPFLLLTWLVPGFWLLAQDLNLKEGPALGRPTLLPEKKSLPVAPIQPVPANQTQSSLPGKKKEGRDLAITIKTISPAPHDLFHLESEADLFQRIRQEIRQTLGPGKVEFPDQASQKPSLLANSRTWDTTLKTVEPNYVCYGRLFFEQRNSERHGWKMGPFHPVLAAGIFYTDILRWPVDYLSAPLRCCDCSAGLCLPGDPVSFSWHPPLHK